MGRKYAQAADEVDPRHRSSKDKNRWCRGRIGVEHVKVWEDEPTHKHYRRPMFPRRERLMCSQCNKEFETRRKVWTFGSLMKANREAKGMSQDTLAMAIGTSQCMIAGWESDKQEIKVASIQKIAEALGVDCSISMGADIVLHGERNRYW